MTEERWGIPDTWSWVSVDDIAEVVGGGTPPAKDPDNFCSDGIPWLTPADLTGYEAAYISNGARDLTEKGLAKSSAKLMPAGAVLYSSRAPIGYCAIAANEISTNQGFKSLVLPDDVLPEFARLYLLASKDYAESKASGTTFKEVSGARVKQFPFPLPPLAEQKRIVEKLDRLSARIRAAKDHLAKTQTLATRAKQATLAAATGASSNSSQSNWRLMSAGELFDWSSGKNLPKRKQIQGPYPVFGGNGEQGKHNEFNREEPTLVIGRVGAQCGNVHLTNTKTWITDNAIYAANISSSVDIKFAELVFASANLNELAGGTGQPYVNQDILNAVEFPDISKEEQTEIVHRIEATFSCIDKIVDEATRATDLLARLEQKLLAKAFRGELVPQDPNDEPASVLLERIREARANSQKKKRTR